MAKYGWKGSLLEGDVVEAEQWKPGDVEQEERLRIIYREDIDGVMKPWMRANCGLFPIREGDYVTVNCAGDRILRREAEFQSNYKLLEPVPV